jgi:hypothetical protein
MTARRATTLFAPLIAILAITTILRAEGPPQRPAGPRPLLAQLNAEVQSLYHEVQSGVCRVQLPPPKWAGEQLADADNPVRKWADVLDPAVKARLEQEQTDAQRGQLRKITASVAPATTRPAEPKAGQSATQSAVGAWSLSTSPDGDDVVVLRPTGPGAGALQFDAGGSLTPDGQIAGAAGRVNVSIVPASSFTPNNIALVLDTQGHVLVPIAIEKESIDPAGVPIMVGPGQMAMAKFVGSDRQTNLTLLKLDKPLGTPVKLSKDHPQEGALAMFLAPNSGVGRLVIWSNEIRDWGVVVSMDGGVYGFTRQGQFLSVAACQPVIDQLKRAGQVTRPKLGLGIAEVPRNDLAREQTPALANRPAVKITEIAPTGPAAKAGLKVGDLILTCNNEPTGDPHSFAAALSAPADKATLTVLRDGKPQDLTLDLEH